MKNAYYIADLLDDIGEEIRSIDEELEAREQFRTKNNAPVFEDDFEFEAAYANI
jgi:hypothetical protein